MINRILTICTGNICRSPIAEALIREHIPGITVASAGVAAVVGHPATEQAQRLASDHGLDITAHRARQVQEEHIAGHDLILVAEQKQLKWLVDSFPQARGRTYLLTHWGEKEDIPDPFRKSPEIYSAAFSMLSTAVEEWRQKLS